MQVTAHKHRDVSFGNQWFEEVENRWDYDDLKNNQLWRENWISFDCAYYEPSQDRIYLGITSFDADIFRAYDRKSGKFLDLGYKSVADPYDAKFHRSLIQGNDGCLYGAVALLHDVDRFHEAPGSPIIKYNPRTGEITRLPPPAPNLYIQSTVYDSERDVLYCMCFPPEKLIAVNLKTGAVRDLGLTSSGIEGITQGENFVLDDDGCIWCNWSITRAWQNTPGPDLVRICKYDPHADRMTFFRSGLPRPDGQHGTSKPEAWFNFSDGFLYASGANGSFFRVNRETGEAKFLFTPTADRPSRLTSLVKTEDGVAYGVTGREGNCELMKVHYQDGTFEKLGDIREEQGASLWQCHHLISPEPGVFYICENDNPYRSAYLWEVRL